MSNAEGLAVGRVVTSREVASLVPKRAKALRVRAARFMTGTSQSPFSAADPALGYLYQVRVGLLWSLRRIKTGDFLVSIETLDDVAFETKGGTPDELLQTKHHRTGTAALSNASPDLWKTLRIWFEAHEKTPFPADTSLHLITTATAADGSAAAYLRSEGRDVDAALAALESTAHSSESAANAPAYSAFLRASGSVRKLLLEMIVLTDAAPQVSDLEDQLRDQIFWAVDPQQHASFLQRLEGWWLRRVLKQLTGVHQGDRILSGEIEAEMSDLREQFKQDSLPIDDDLLTFSLDDTTQDSHANSTFVHQMVLARAGKKRVAAAVRDYYRAFEQRSRWLREDLLLVGDLAKYENRLVEQWELIFEAVKDEVGVDSADEAKEAAARQVLQWAEQVIVPIRPRVTEPFVTRGSLHILSDEIRIGWHPDFRDRLAALLGNASGEAK
jgi:C-terminal domain 7 of the ABC-three component (ABC-3C) systems